MHLHIQTWNLNRPQAKHSDTLPAGQVTAIICFIDHKIQLDGLSDGGLAEEVKRGEAARGEAARAVRRVVVRREPAALLVVRSLLRSRCRNWRPGSIRTQYSTYATTEGRCDVW